MPSKGLTHYCARVMSLPEAEAGLFAMHDGVVGCRLSSDGYANEWLHKCFACVPHVFPLNLTGKWKQSPFYLRVDKNKYGREE